MRKMSKMSQWFFPVVSLTSHPII